MERNYEVNYYNLKVCAVPTRVASLSTHTRVLCTVAHERGVEIKLKEHCFGCVLQENT